MTVYTNYIYQPYNLVSMQKIATLIFTIILLIIVAACNKDNYEERLNWLPESSKLIADGVNAGYGQSNFSLEYTSTLSDSPQIECSEDWIDVSIKQNENQGTLHIELLENSDTSERKGTVKIIYYGSRYLINIKQDGSPKVILENNKYKVSSEGGRIEIDLKANGNLSAEVFPTDTDWVKVISTSKESKTDYKVILEVAKNDGFGRIASIDFRINGNVAIKKCGPCIIQSPAKFDESVEVSSKVPGTLQILLGDNKSNLLNIKHITIDGPINGLDFYVLKELLGNNSESRREYPLEIDMSDCNIVSGNKNPYEYYGWSPDGEYTDIFFNSEIPSNIFTDSQNLKDILLPKSLKIIGRSAFANCVNLKRIVIPNLVEEINSKAFWNCSGLENIDIDKSSCLTTIGNQAFTTNSVLKDLIIPITVTDISSEAFLGCSTSRLHLYWTEPFEVKLVPQTDGCTLIVPKGTIELYREAKNWCKFNTIIEDDN